MNKTHCTSSRSRNVRVLMVAACMFAILSALPLSGQDKDKNKNSNHVAANLRIRVHIVRATFHQHGPKHEFRDQEDVVFPIPGDALKADVIEEERLLSEKESRTLLDGKSGTVVLKTQTIVLP